MQPLVKRPCSSDTYMRCEECSIQLGDDIFLCNSHIKGGRQNCHRHYHVYHQNKKIRQSREINIPRDPRDMRDLPHIVFSPPPNRNIYHDGHFRHGQIVLSLIDFLIFNERVTKDSYPCEWGFEAQNCCVSVPVKDTYLLEKYKQ